MGNHPCEKFPQENYNGEDLHSSRRRSESSMALEDEEDKNTFFLFCSTVVLSSE